MKIKSLLELQDRLDKSLSHRKMELTALHLLINRLENTIEIDTILRASILVMYSHWEGFLKQSSVIYINFVYHQLARGRDFNSNFIALALKKEIKSAGKSKKTSEHTRLVNSFLNTLEQQIRIDCESLIDTESNLSSRVLEELFKTLGIAFDDYWRKKTQMIDYKLLSKRNLIAHGGLDRIELDEYKDIYNFVIESLNKFKTTIEFCATNEAYKNAV